MKTQRQCSERSSAEWRIGKEQSNDLLSEFPSISFRRERDIISIKNNEFHERHHLHILGPQCNGNPSCCTRGDDET